MSVFGKRRDIPRWSDLVVTVRTFCMLGTAMVLGACGGVETCEEPEFYEFAEGGTRIEAPEGLDDLAAFKEMVIPEASPRPPRDRSKGCLDRPPSLQTDTG